MATPTTTAKRKVAIRYTTRACDFCKQRHLRCDGQQQCHQCKKRKQTCSYVQKNVKRGPKPKKKLKNESSPTGESDDLGGEYLLVQPKKFHPDIYEGENVFIGRPNIREDTEQKLASFASPSSDVTIATLMAFAEKISPVCPNNFNLNAQVAFNVWKQMASNYQYTKLGELVDAFVYCVVFGHGARVVSNEMLSMEFTIKAEALSHILFFSSSSLSPEMYCSHADSLVACLTLLGVLRIECDDFNAARLCFIQGYDVLNMHVNNVSPRVAHRLYAHLAGMSRSTSDMNHWVSNAHLLGPEAGTAINRVMLSLLYCCPSMLRDPKNKPIPPTLHIPPTQAHLKQKDLMLYQRMLRELDESEEIVWEHDPTNKQIGFHESLLPFSADYITSFKLIIDGCRSMVLAQCGYQDQATICAERCITYSEHLSTRILYWAMPLGLAYALQVARATNNQHLLQEGMSVMQQYAPHYPFVPQIIQILTSKPQLFDIPAPLEINEIDHQIPIPMDKKPGTPKVLDGPPPLSDIPQASHIPPPFPLIHRPMYEAGDHSNVPYFSQIENQHSPNSQGYYNRLY